MLIVKTILNDIYGKKRNNQVKLGYFLVGRGGFEPPKELPADLQSAPFGHSGTYPYI